MDIDQENLEKRRAVWVALSDLFLDSDVSTSYDYISRVCAESSYSLEELNHILRYEVAPVCLPNLWSIAGEWAGFNEEWLVASIQKKLRAKSFLPKRLLSYLNNVGFRTYIQVHWDSLETRIIARRTQM
ncbi:MAG TPA: hypothetical protein VN030_00490 [Cellvibrio sp.]|nr:hypothetical protein [Cellvibrio sp.]